MRRTAIFISMLVLLLSLALVSCDAMFTSNVFAKITHPTPSAADMSSKTPDQLQTYAGSQYGMSVLANDPALKEAALAAAAAYYLPSTGYTPDPTTPEVQTAAIVAADISINTVPDAASLTGGILSFVLDSNNKVSTTTTEETTTLIQGILPDDIKNAVLGGGEMPSSFTDMIAAYSQANAAFMVLGAGIEPAVTGAKPVFADGTSLAAGQANSIAVNAMISGLLTAVKPMVAGTSTPIVNPTPDELAAALWTALVDPTTVSATAANPPITIDPLAFNALIGTTTTSTGADLIDPKTGVKLVASPISYLIAAAGLDTLFTGGK
jgi:hypothetical protein